MTGRSEPPLERAVQDYRALKGEVTKFANELIADANRRAEKLNGKTFVRVREHGRVMFFVPAPKTKRGAPPAGDPVIPDAQLTPDPGGPLSGPPPHLVIPDVELTIPDVELTADPEGALSRPPPDAVRREWKDRFGLAQEYRLRYRFGRIKSMHRTNDLARPYEAVVELKLKVTSRLGVAQDVQPIPKPPTGMVPWWPQARGLRSRFFGSGGRHGLWVPEFKGWLDSPGSETLARKAVEALKGVKAGVDEGTTECRLAFFADKGRWVCAGQKYDPECPRPADIPWERGLPKEQIRETIFPPGYYPKLKPATRPAPRGK